MLGQSFLRLGLVDESCGNNHDFIRIISVRPRTSRPPQRRLGRRLSTYTARKTRRSAERIQLTAASARPPFSKLLRSSRERVGVSSVWPLISWSLISGLPVCWIGIETSEPAKAEEG
jgi:hypothetical protein